jgi:hypothetical protein
MNVLTSPPSFNDLIEPPKPSPAKAGPGIRSRG